MAYLAKTKKSMQALFLTKHASNCREIKEILPMRLDARLALTQIMLYCILLLVETRCERAFTLVMYKVPWRLT